MGLEERAIVLIVLREAAVSVERKGKEMKMGDRRAGLLLLSAHCTTGTCMGRLLVLVTGVIHCVEHRLSTDYGDI